MTDSFLGLGPEKTKCQNGEMPLDCRTDQMLDLIKTKCGCTPLGLLMGSFEQVNRTSPLNIDYISMRQYYGNISFKKRSFTLLSNLCLGNLIFFNFFIRFVGNSLSWLA